MKESYIHFENHEDTIPVSIGNIRLDAYGYSIDYRTVHADIPYDDITSMMEESSQYDTELSYLGNFLNDSSSEDTVDYVIPISALNDDSKLNVLRFINNYIKEYSRYDVIHEETPSDFGINCWGIIGDEVNPSEPLHFYRVDMNSQCSIYSSMVDMTDNSNALVTYLWSADNDAMCFLAMSLGLTFGQISKIEWFDDIDYDATGDEILERIAKVL